MNPKLLAFLHAQLASHRRTTRYTDELASVVLGEKPYAIECCTCGFEVTRPTMARAAQPGTRAYLQERSNVSRVVESQWTDHLVETIALGVADWLAVGAPPEALETADVERVVNAVRGIR
jgi:hypothetical protein